MKAYALAADFARSFTGRVMLGMLGIHLALIPPLTFTVLNAISDDYREQFVDYVRSQSAQFAQMVGWDRDENRIRTLMDEILLGGQVIYVDYVIPGRPVLTPGRSRHAPVRFVEDFRFGENGDDIYFVQLAASGSEEEAQRLSHKLQAELGDNLGQRELLVFTGTVKDKTVYRVRVGELSREEANAMCQRLKGKKACFVAKD